MRRGVEQRIHPKKLRHVSTKIRSKRPRRLPKRVIQERQAPLENLDVHVPELRHPAVKRVCRKRIERILHVPFYHARLGAAVLILVEGVHEGFEEKVLVPGGVGGRVVGTKYASRFDDALRCGFGWADELAHAIHAAVGFAGSTSGDTCDLKIYVCGLCCTVSRR